MRARALLAVILGGGLLVWPAIANGYPLLFSDTGAFLAQLLVPFMVWDKPYVYGPALAVVSLKLTLWLPALAQGLLLSWVLWRVRAALRPASAAWHLGLCAVLAVGTAAPWFAAMLMPDIFAPLTVLALFLLAYDELAYDETGRRRWPLYLLAGFAIATHLTHLIIAADCIGVLVLLRPRAVPRVAVPLLGALALLLATNLVGHGRFGVSPYGSLFALARMVADGPARTYLADACPGAGYHLCSWVGRLPENADAFLWDPEGPVWTSPDAPKGLAPEASRIVQATILAQPVAVARAALANTVTQLGTLRLDEVIGDYWLDETVGFRLRNHYPAAEEARFQAGAQRHDRLRAIGGPLQSPQIALVGVGAVLTLGVLAWAWRRDRRLFALAALCVVGILANAFATGALSGPHDRYGARIAWLLVLVPLLVPGRPAGARGRAGD